MGWAALLCVLGSEGLGAAIVDPQPTLFLRLLTPISTRDSRPGSGFAATVTRPFLVDGAAAVPVGAQVYGTVVESRGVGLGLKRERARLSLRFDEVTLPNGDRLTLKAALAGFDNAREDLDRAGRVKGIRATNELSERMNIRLGGVRLTPFRLAYRSMIRTFPFQAGGVWLASSLIFGIPDPEIHYPAGSDFELRLTEPWSHEARFEDYRGERPVSLTAEEGQEFWQRQPRLSYLEKNGAEGDPVNLVLVGPPARAFEAAGWHGADQRLRRNCFRAMRAAATSSPYARGPMTTLLLDDRRPDAEWQKGLNTYAKRHHLRVWRAEGNWDGQDAWLVAATHDTGLTVKGLRVTHDVDRRLDRERERVVADLMLTGCVDSVHHIASERVGSRTWVTDGRVAVVHLNACAAPRAAPTSGPPTSRSAGWRLLQRITLNARNTLLRENNIYRGYDFVRNVVQWRKRNADLTE